MKKRTIFLLHFGYWTIYLLLLLVIFSIVQIQFKKTVSFPSTLFLSPVGVACIVPNLFAFYLFYFLLFPWFLQRKKSLALIFFGALACLVSALSGSLVLGVLYGFEQPVFHDPGEFSGLALWMFLVGGIHGGIALVIRGFVGWYEEINLKEELDRKNHEMELALIRSHLDPHFLFNTINNIDVLIAQNTVKASEYLNGLSEILRYVLYETGEEKILLSRELAYIEKYLELQKIRTSNPDYVKYEVTGDAGNSMIAPILFFPFIENAFKHTENKKHANTINIKILIERETCVFECENTYQDTFEAKKGYGGLGNELIEKRLKLLYGDLYLLQITDNNGIYKVKLSLDML
jgi:two-component system LytT family sensor kinase